MRRPVVALAVAAALTVLLWLLPFGRLVGRPLLWWSTLAHEGGHGLAAIVAGGTWQRLQLFADGSGVATSAYAPGARALVAAGGLVGPACAALALFVVGAVQRTARLALLATGLACLALLPTVASGAFTVAFVAAAGTAAIGAGVWLSAPAARVALLFLAVQLSLSVFSRADYLFTATAVTGAGTMPSDVAQVVAGWGGTVTVWGAMIGAFSIAVLAAGLGFLVVVDRVVVRLDAWRAARAARAARPVSAAGAPLL
jgi:hypothetical protein